MLELLPPSPTRLSFSGSASSGSGSGAGWASGSGSVAESDVDAPRPSPISELVRICAGGRAVERAESVRSARIEVETEDGTIVRPSSRFLGFGLGSPFGSPSSPSARSVRSARSGAPGSSPSTGTGTGTGTSSSAGGLLGLGGRGAGVWGAGGASGPRPGERLLRLAMPWRRREVTEPIRVTTSPTPSARDAPFAREVEVKGWQIVGGRNFDDKARVGAYVGAFTPLEQASRLTRSVRHRAAAAQRLDGQHPPPVHRVRPAAQRAALRVPCEYGRRPEHAALRSCSSMAQCADWQHLGQTIPPLPGKNHMRKFSPDFLEDRRPRLQRFLRTVALHPEMGAGGPESVFGQWVLGYKGESPVESRPSAASAASGASGATDPSAASAD